MKVLYTLVAVCVLASGCAKARAKTMPDAPLDMPLPPPREVAAPEEAEAPPPVPLATEPARTRPPRPRPSPAPPREQPPAQPRPEPPKQEPPRAETPPPEVRPTEEPHTPTTLQTTPATAEGVVERTVRTTLTRATNDLNRIDYRGLNADARQQYDTAKRFIRQAEDAVKTKNLVYAKNLADKAVVIAAQLAGR
jgi:hypothetical protein